MDNVVHVVLAADSAVSAGLAVAGFSAIQHTSRPVVIWVIYDGLDRETITALRAFWKDAAEVHFVPLKGVPWWWETERFPPVAWARIRLSNLLPNHVSRCIYLDTDTLVGRDLAELSDMPLDSKPIAMVLDSHMANPDFFPGYLRSLGMDPNRYYNSGVVLIDLAAWRRTGAMEGLMHCKSAMPRTLYFADQDLINNYFKGSILTLDKVWNIVDPWREFSPEGRVLHFAGLPKPWEQPDLVSPGLRLWREAYALWGRQPAPRPKSRVKLMSADIARRLIILTRNSQEFYKTIDKEASRLKQRKDGPSCQKTANSR
jgi:lipopolysaccharide biosynthesis glycosyltransferase